MIHIAIVEDDDHYADKLKDNLNRYSEERKEPVRITRFDDGEDIVTDYAADYDIILMDIELKFLDGMTAAERIRDMDPEVVIIFITNMPQYAIKGYKVDALDYVLKPVSYFALSQRLDRAFSRMRKRMGKKYMNISVKGGLVRLDTSKITYVEVQDHDLIFHTTDGDYSSKGTMKDVEMSLSDSLFFRCSKCYLVNMEYVRGFQNSDITVGGDVIRVSRGRKKEFLDAMNNYLNEVSK